MTQYKTIYKCGRCGTTSYQPVIGRDATGALKPTGQYRCTGCKMTFFEFREWWGHDGAAHGHNLSGGAGLSGGSGLSALSMSSALG